MPIQQSVMVEWGLQGYYYYYYHSLMESCHRILSKKLDYLGFKIKSKTQNKLKYMLFRKSHGAKQSAVNSGNNFSIFFGGVDVREFTIYFWESEFYSYFGLLKNWQTIFLKYSVSRRQAFGMPVLEFLPEF